MLADPKSAKRQSTQALFELLGALSIKAVHKHVAEIDSRGSTRDRHSVTGFDGEKNGR